MGKFDCIIEKLCNVRIRTITDRPIGCYSFMVGGSEYFIKGVGIDRDRLIGDMEYLEGLLLITEGKLGNKSFIDNAPIDVVVREYDKRDDIILKINLINSQICVEKKG